VLESLAQQWAIADTPGALAWAGNLPASGERDQFLSRIAFVESQENPVAAASLVVDQISPGSAQDEAAMSVLHQWAGRDLTAAADWVARFPEGPLRTRARNELAGIIEARGFGPVNQPGAR
jgi:hypothetical protein